MAKGRISKRTVDAFEADPEALTAQGIVKDAYLWDDALPGFGVKATGAGNKVYLYQFRDEKGKTRRMTIGGHGKPWTPEKARKAAEDYAAQAQLAKNGQVDGPAKKRKNARKKFGTVRETVPEYFEERMHKGKLKESTRKEYERLFESHLYPKYGNQELSDIDQGEIEKLHRGLRNTPYQANRLVAAMGGLFTWAIRNRIYEGANPCSFVEKYGEDKRERFLSPAEMARLGNALADDENVRPSAVGVTRLLVLTGMRKGEALNLKWDCVDLEKGLVRLSDSKTGAKSIPLSAPAKEALVKTANFRIKDNPYVFPGVKKGRPLVGLQKIWERWRNAATVAIWSDDTDVAPLVEKLREELERMPTVKEVRNLAKKRKIKLPRGMDDIRIHDFRHSFASVGASAGDSLVVLGSILGHKNQATTQRYAHLYDDARQAAADRIGGQIAAGLAGEEGEVVPFPKKA